MDQGQGLDRDGGISTWIDDSMMTEKQMIHPPTFPPKKQRKLRQEIGTLR